MNNHLTHFLHTYMHQDWTLFGKSLPQVLVTYMDDTSPDDLQALQSDIHNLIRQEGQQIHTTYFTLFPDSVTPAGYNMTVIGWLKHISTMIDMILS